MKKILIAAGIFPPDIGGPATYIAELRGRLEEKGFDVCVVTYGQNRSREYGVVNIPRSWPVGYRHLMYFLAVLLKAKGSDLIYTHDTSAAGLPALWVSRIFKKPLFLRVGGDIVWEREIGAQALTVREFYQKGMHKKSKYFNLNKKVMQNARKIIVPSTILKELYQDYYGISRDKIYFVPNPFPGVLSSGDTAAPNNKIILYAGRFQMYKNLETLIMAFDRVALKDGLLELHLIGSGPDKERLVSIASSMNSRARIFIRPGLEHSKLLEIVKSCFVAVAPSFTEFSPNFVLEVLSCERPVVISKDQGLDIDFPKELVFSPGSVEELTEKLTHLLDLPVYQGALDWVEKLPKSWGWEDVIKRHIELLELL